MIPGMEKHAEDLQDDLAETIGPPEKVGAACLAPGQFWATDHWIVCPTLWSQFKRRNTKRFGERSPEEDIKQK